MKKFIGFLTFVFSLVILFSCEPSRDVNGDLLFGLNNEGQTGGGTTATRLLKKMISHGLNDETGEWEDETLTYNYLNNKLMSYSDESGELTSFEYSANNKISRISSSGQTTDFQYAGGNVAMIKTDLAGVAKINSTFTYTGTKVTKSISIQDYSAPFPMKMYFETTYEYQGENMVKALFKTGVYSPTGELEMSPEDQNVVITFSYDTKKSPYRLLPNEFITYLAGFGFHGAAYFSANNFTKMTATQGGIPVITAYTHIYDSENYPVETKNGDEYLKYEYIKP